jgi:hypothetical protein
VIVTVVLPLQPFASVTVNVYVPAVLVKVPAPVYGAVPPVAVTVTVVLPPLQAIGVKVDATVSAGGSVMVSCASALQPFASVTVNVYVPAAFVKVPVPVYGADPPVAETVTVEVPPLQAIGVALAVTTIGGGPVTVTDVVAVQPFASVTVKLCVPAGTRKVPVPVYGVVPPVADTVTVELSLPQSSGVAVDEALSCGGSVMVTDVVTLQPFASVTV